MDNIALLDVLCAYRVAVTESSGEYVQPTCMERGPIAIVGGHHPLIENCLDGRQYQPNDTYLAGTSWESLRACALPARAVYTKG